MPAGDKAPEGPRAGSAAGATEAAEGTASPGGSRDGGVSGDGAGGGEEAPTKREAAAPDDASAHFKSKPHHDSGGGAAQFETKGGDNSIQESGAEASSAELAQAAAALHGYLDARAAGAWEAACSYAAASLTATLRQFAASSPQLEDAGCPELLAAFSAGMPDYAKRAITTADAGSLRVEGDSAYLLFRGAHEADYFMPMAREGGQWKVAAIAASAIP